MQTEQTELYSVLTEGYQPPRQMLHITTGDPTPAFSLRWAEQMMNDPQVGLGMSINTAPIMKAKIELSGNPDITKFVEKTIRDIWLFMLPKVVYGYYMTVSGGEVIYERDPNGQTCFKEYRDVHPSDLRILHKNFDFKGLRVQNSRQSSLNDQNRDDVILIGPKAFLYVHKRRYGSWEGQSDLRPAFKHWLARADFNGADASARLWFYKNSFGGGTIYHPRGNYTYPGGRTVPYREIALQMGSLITNGNVLAFESIIDAETKQQVWRYEPPVLNGDGKPLLDYVDHLDVRIHRGMGIPDDILSQQSSTGTGYSGKTIPLAVFGQGRTLILRETFFAIKEQIIDPLVKLNYGPNAIHGYTVEKVEVDMDALMPSAPDKTPQPGMQAPPGEDKEPLNLDQPEKPAQKPQQFGSDDDHPRAPKNGVVIGGKKYAGGEYIPKEVIASMTPEQKDRLADAMEKTPHTDSQRSIIDININDTSKQAEPAAPKQLHEMSLEEFTEDARKDGITSDFKDRWRSVVRRARDKGLTLPDHVNKQYEETTPASQRPYVPNIPDPKTAKQDFDLVPATEKFDPRDPTDDGYYYHVTTKGAASKIMKKGIVPNSPAAMDAGVYREYSKGKAFLTDRGGVNFWKMTIENHLESQGKRGSNLVVLRVPKQAIGELQKDELGTKDARANAYYATAPIKPNSEPLKKSSNVAELPPALSKWFGTSKVVDPAGKPLMVYHGTSGDFDRFDEGRTIKGIFASDDPREAARFGDTGEGKHSLKPLYMKIENPKILDMKGKLFDFKMVNARVIQARNDGNDGVIVQNVKNFPDSAPSNTYIALKANQAKSATANSGKFDPDSDSLTDVEP